MNATIPIEDLLALLKNALRITDKSRVGSIAILIFIINQYYPVRAVLSKSCDCVTIFYRDGSAREIK